MKSSIYEQALTKHGVRFEYHESIDLDDIDLGKGIRNQARLSNPVEEELVEQYADAYLDKMEFPPIVLWRPGKGRWIPVDGNNRLAACARAKKKWHDAYVIDCQDQQVIDRITWTFNNMVNGKRLSREECIEHAVSFVQKYGMTHETAAKEWGVSIASVRRTVRNNRLKEVLQANGVKKMPDERSLERLGSLETAGDDVFVGAVKVVVESGVGPVECEQLVKDVRNARTHEQKVKVVDEFAKSEFVRQRQAETKGGKIQPKKVPPRESLKRLVHQAVLLFDNFPDKNALKPAPVEYKAARLEAADLCNKLITLFGLGALLREEAV